ncbi:MAG: hypothetical protein JW729_01585 [Bacteroidales bacterium]|nr:hypothetical protein [Bacteroidales bacterium]
MNRIKFTFWVFLFGLVLTSSSCLKSDDCGECFTPPPQLYFKVIDATIGQNLYDDFTYNANDLKLYYKNGDDLVYIDVNIYDYFNERIISSNDMSWLAISDIGETFYLVLSPTETETIFLQIDALFENCCTYHMIHQLTINGIEPEQDSSDFSILIKK